MQVLNAVTERLMDFDEKVRSAAIAAICDAAVRNLQVEASSWNHLQMKDCAFHFQWAWQWDMDVCEIQSIKTLHCSCACE